MKVVEHSGRIRHAGALAVFVTFDHPEAVRRVLLAGIHCPWPVLVDTDRTAYRVWGLGRLSFAELWLDPNVYRQYARLLLGGERIRGTGSDRRQLGGDFVVDRAGRIAYTRPQRRDDRPPVGMLVNALEAVAQ